MKRSQKLTNLTPTGASRGQTSWIHGNAQYYPWSDTRVAEVDSCGRQWIWAFHFWSPTSGLRESGITLSARVWVSNFIESPFRSHRWAWRWVRPFLRMWLKGETYNNDNPSRLPNLDQGAITDSHSRSTSSKNTLVCPCACDWSLRSERPSHLFIPLARDKVYPVKLYSLTFTIIQFYYMLSLSCPCNQISESILSMWSMWRPLAGENGIWVAFAGRSIICGAVLLSNWVFIIPYIKRLYCNKNGPALKY